MAKNHDTSLGMAFGERNHGDGSLLSAISTAIVGIRRRHYGRGAMHAKTYVNDDLIVVVTRANGLTAFERTLMERGEPERVIAIRNQFLELMADRYTQTVEQLTGRRVLAFLHQVSLEPDVTIESFVLDTPFDGAKQVEVSAVLQRPKPRAELSPPVGVAARRA